MNYNDFLNDKELMKYFKAATYNVFNSQRGVRVVNYMELEDYQQICHINLMRDFNKLWVKHINEDIPIKKLIGKNIGFTMGQINRDLMTNRRRQDTELNYSLDYDYENYENGLKEKLSDNIDYFRQIDSMDTLTSVVEFIPNDKHKEIISLKLQGMNNFQIEKTTKYHYRTIKNAIDKYIPIIKDKIQKNELVVI